MQGLISAHNDFKQTLGEADNEFKNIVALVTEVENIGRQFSITSANDNPYTTLSAQVRLHIFYLPNYHSYPSYLYSYSLIYLFFLPRLLAN